MDEALYKRTVDRLECDLLKNVVTLKYLSLYRDGVTLNLAEEGAGWAVSLLVPKGLLALENAEFPAAQWSAFINGTSEKLKYDLLDQLPSATHLLRLNEPLDLSRYADKYAVSSAFSYVSLSISVFNGVPAAAIEPETELTDEVIRLFTRNGYREAQLRQYFSEGAVWFGHRTAGEIKSACFIYHNYGNIWEIAGLRTLDAEQNKGYARAVVSCALRHILEHDRVPRYVTRDDNEKSIRLAQSLGMKQILTLRQFLLAPL
jgi:hypothetical protein